MGIVAAYIVPHPPLIVPEVGRGQERVIQRTVDAYREVARRIAAHAPDTVIVSSPHAPAHYDCFHISTGDVAHGDMRSFGAFEASLTAPYDTEFVSVVNACARKHGIPLCGSGMRDGELDHGTFVPLHFVSEALSEYRLVRVGLSGLSPEDHRQLGRCIAEAAKDLRRRCVYIASGDLSHKLLASGPYGFASEGPAFDREVTALMEAGDVEGFFGFDATFLNAAAECGLGSFQIMAGALEDAAFTHELLSYEGPFGVGYAVAAFEVQDLGAATADDGKSESKRELASDAQVGGTENACAAARADGELADSAACKPADVDPYVALARASVEGFVRAGRPIEVPAGLPPSLTKERAGVFVSLHAHGDLRGCIGTIAATTGSVAEEIIRNGVAAASEDLRFSPVREDELAALSYSVDVLFPSEPVTSEAELDATRYGVIVTKGFRRGLLLPNLEGVDTVADQVAIAKRKAGIDPRDTDVRLERFEVVRHTRGGEARAERA